MKSWVVAACPGSGTFWNLHNQYGPQRGVEKAEISKYRERKKKNKKEGREGGRKEGRKE